MGQEACENHCPFHSWANSCHTFPPGAPQDALAPHHLPQLCHCDQAAGMKAMASGKDLKLGISCTSQNPARQGTSSKEGETCGTTRGTSHPPTAQPAAAPIPHAHGLAGQRWSCTSRGQVGTQRHHHPGTEGRYVVRLPRNFGHVY